MLSTLFETTIKRVQSSPQANEMLTVGREIGDALATLFRQAIQVSNMSEHMTTFTFFRFGPFPPLQERGRIALSDKDRALFQSALRLRDQSSLSFWDCVFLAMMRSGDLSQNLLHHALDHCSHRKTEFKISYEQLEKGHLSEILRGTAPNTKEPWIAVTSEVRLTGGQSLHLPMLDFRCEKKPMNQRLVREICKQLLSRGFVIVDSGASYHAYGRELVEQEELITFLSRALLFGPAIDRSYVAHQLIERRCALRVSAGGKAETSFSPKITDVWEPDDR